MCTFWSCVLELGLEGSVCCYSSTTLGFVIPWSYLRSESLLLHLQWSNFDSFGWQPLLGCDAVLIGYIKFKNTLHCTWTVVLNKSLRMLSSELRIFFCFQLFCVLHCVWSSFIVNNEICYMNLMVDQRKLMDIRNWLSIVAKSNLRF